MKDLPSRRVLAAALVAVALFAAGCSKNDNKTTNPIVGIGQLAADDVAVQTNAALVPTELDLTGATAGSDTSTFLGFGILPGWASVDTTFTRAGFTVHVTRTFFDATNTPLATYDTTATYMVWTSQIHGGRLTPLDSLVIGHAASFTFTGLKDTVLTMNGSALDTLFNRFRKLSGDTIRFVSSTSVMTASNVRLPRDGIRQFPLSGTLTYVITADRLRSANPADRIQRVTATVVITFNGTVSVPVIVNGTYRYNLNLQTGLITRVV